MVETTYKRLMSTGNKALIKYVRDAMENRMQIGLAQVPELEFSLWRSLNVWDFDGVPDCVTFVHLVVHTPELQ
jgi:hypothetical protein